MYEGMTLFDKKIGILGNRSIARLYRAAIGVQHYQGFINMYRYYPNFLTNLKRYMTGKGEYPYQCEIRTTMGIISPTLYSQFDLKTVTEIFCREEYFADEAVETVVDIGSNIGISAQYFLTRNAMSKCYLFEPNPANIPRLKKNLRGYEDRFFLQEVAVSDMRGVLQFGVESTGRFGGLMDERIVREKPTKYIQVACLHINEVLESIVCQEEIIDVLKIDIEGLELETVEAIDRRLLKCIRKIYLEGKPRKRMHPDLFTQKQRGGVCSLTNKTLDASR